MTWKIEFIIDSSKIWRDSPYRFPDPISATSYADGIAPVRRYRLVESTDNPAIPPSPQSPPWTSPSIP